jgi:hypothetical protein
MRTLKRYVCVCVCVRAHREFFRWFKHKRHLERKWSGNGTEWKKGKKSALEPFRRLININMHERCRNSKHATMTLAYREKDRSCFGNSAINVSYTCYNWTTFSRSVIFPSNWAGELNCSLIHGIDTVQLQILLLSEPTHMQKSETSEHNTSDAHALPIYVCARVNVHVARM